MYCNQGHWQTPWTRLTPKAPRNHVLQPRTLTDIMDTTDTAGTKKPCTATKDTDRHHGHCRHIRHQRNMYRIQGRCQRLWTPQIVWTPQTLWTLQTQKIPRYHVQNSRTLPDTTDTTDIAGTKEVTKDTGRHHEHHRHCRYHTMNHGQNLRTLPDTMDTADTEDTKKPCTESKDAVRHTIDTTDTQGTKDSTQGHWQTPQTPQTLQAPCKEPWTESKDNARHYEHHRHCRHHNRNYVLVARTLPDSMDTTDTSGTKEACVV